MSLASWKAEFYPVPVSRIKTVAGALKHSLRKWKGLRAGALRRHKVEEYAGYVNQQGGGMSPKSFPMFPIDDSTCALCKIVDKGGQWKPHDCQQCVLTQVRGGYPCTDVRVGEGHSPWLTFTGDGNPEPMIRLLEKALASLKRKH
jgi:hypothetical protein